MKKVKEKNPGHPSFHCILWQKGKPGWKENKNFKMQFKKKF